MGSPSRELLAPGVECFARLYGLLTVEADLGDLPGAFIRWEGGGVIVFNLAHANPYSFLTAIFSVNTA